MMSLLDDDLFSDDKFLDDFALEAVGTPPKPKPPAQSNGVTLRLTAGLATTSVSRHPVTNQSGLANGDAGDRSTTNSKRPSTFDPALSAKGGSVARHHPRATRPTTNIGTDGSRLVSSSEAIVTTPGSRRASGESEFDFGDGYDDDDFALVDADRNSNTNSTDGEELTHLPTAHSNRGLIAATTIITKKPNACSTTTTPLVTNVQVRHTGPSRSLPYSPRDSLPSPTIPHKIKLLQPNPGSCVEEWRTRYQNEAWLALERDVSLELKRDTSILKRFNLASVIRKADRKSLPNRKARLVCVLLDSIFHTATDASATFVDPSGKISGTIDQDLLINYPGQMRAGSVFVLGQVSVFSPRPKRHYLNVTVQSILHVYWMKDQKVMHDQLVDSSWADLVEEAESATNRGQLDTPGRLEPPKSIRPGRLSALQQTPQTFLAASASPATLATRRAADIAVPVVRQCEVTDHLAQYQIAANRPAAAVGRSDLPGPSASGVREPVTGAADPQEQGQHRPSAIVGSAGIQSLESDIQWADDGLTDDMFANIDC